MCFKFRGARDIPRGVTHLDGGLGRFSWQPCHCREPECRPRRSVQMLRAHPGREGKQHLTQKPGRSRAAHRCAPAASPSGYCRASRTPASTRSPTHPGSPRASGAQEPASILTPLLALPLGALPLQLQAPLQASFALQPRWFTTASLPRTARYPGVCSRA